MTATVDTPSDIPGDTHGDTDERRPGPRLRRRGRPVTIFGAVIVVAAGVVASSLVRDTPTALERAGDLLADNGRFVNGAAAAAAVGDVSELLRDDALACRRDRGQTDPRCGARMSAAAFASVTAFVVAECTAPGIYGARRALLSYLERVGRLDEQPLGSMTVPEPPDVPTCEESGRPG